MKIAAPRRGKCGQLGQEPVCCCGEGGRCCVRWQQRRQMAETDRRDGVGLASARGRGRGGGRGRMGGETRRGSAGGWDGGQGRRHGF